MTRRDGPYWLGQLKQELAASKPSAPGVLVAWLGYQMCVAAALGCTLPPVNPPIMRAE